MIALTLSIVAAYAFFLPADPDREAGAGLVLRTVRFALVSGLLIWLIESRRCADGAVRESEERFRGTFDNAAVGIAHHDADGRSSASTGSTARSSATPATSCSA